MTVYFDPRKPKKSPEEMTEEEKNYELGKSVVKAVANLTVVPLVLMLVWNAVIPGIFALPTLTYFSALGLYVIAKLLLKTHD